MTISILAVYLFLISGYSLISCGHSLLHLTSEIIEIHEHGHSHHHAVEDHGTIFETMKEAADDENKTDAAHFNLITLIAFERSITDIVLNKPTKAIPIFSFHFNNYKSVEITPSTPPPIG